MVFALIYGILGAFLASAFLFMHDHLDGRRRSDVSTYSLLAFFTGLMFFFISMEINESVNVVLISIFSICFHFLILNRIRAAKSLEMIMFFMVVITTMLIGFNQINTINYQMFFLYPIFLFMRLTLVKYMAKFFISSEVIEWNEIILMSICSVIVINVEGLTLVSYIILVAIFYLVWGIFCRVVNKRSYIFLLPAIECSVMTCILAEKFAMLVQHFIQ